MAYEADRLGFLLRARDEFGALVAFDERTTLVNDVRLAHEVLRNQERAFAILGNFRGERVTPTQAEEASRVGAGLNAGLRATAVAHLRPRAAAQVEVAISSALTTSKDLVELQPALQDSLSRVVNEFYFGADWEAPRDAIGRLLDALGTTFGNPFGLPSFLPSPSRLRIRARYRAARAAIDPLIAARRTRSDDGDYVAQVALGSRLRDASPQRVADSIIGSLLAAHQIPAVGATWALLELARVPQIQDKLARDNRDSKAGLSGEPSRRTSAVVLEATRLHPPTWILNRTVTRRTALDGYVLPPGHQVIVSPYVIHRDPRLFAKPEKFDIDRWADTSMLRGYLAFGRGLHACPGQHLGLALMTSAVQAVVRRWHLVHPACPDLKEDPRSSLVPASSYLQLIPRDLGSYVSGGCGNRSLVPGQPPPASPQGAPRVAAVEAPLSCLSRKATG